MKSKDLDFKIRETAIRKLRNKILDQSYTLLNLMGCGGSNHKVKIKTINMDTVEVYDKDTINELIRVSVERQSDRVGDMAVNAFIKKVETLQDEIDNIYENIN